MSSNQIDSSGRQRSAGEVDLDAIGEVVRIFHENPVTAPIKIDGMEQPIRLQSVPLAMSVEELNNIWSTQGDVIYRPSVAYEFALVPIVPNSKPQVEQLVGALGLAVSPIGAPKPVATVTAPPFAGGRVRAEAHDWTPLVCFLQDGQCEQSLFLPAHLAASAPFRVWVAGRLDNDNQLALHWQIWTQDGWRKTGSPVSVTPTTERIDPAKPIATPALMPPPDTDALQWVLYAERPSKGDQPSRLSNPLLVTLVPEKGRVQ